MGYARALYRTGADNPANRAEAFEAAQWARQNEAADALSAMAARFAKGGEALARLVREEQDLRAAREAAYRGLDTAAGKADAKGAANAHASIADIEDRLARKRAALRESFPGYAELANPRPLALTQAQALLAEDEALVAFLDLPQFGKVPEETIIFALTRDDVRWGSANLGSSALRERVKALRCGLDGSNWYGGAQSRDTCVGLLGPEAAAQKSPPFDAAGAHALYRELSAGLKTSSRASNCSSCRPAP